jgi:RNA polymerase-binding protein DksA
VNDGIFMEEKETNKSGLTSAEVRKFKALLLAKRTEILSNIISMEDEALKKSRQDASGDLSSMPIHMADMGTDNFDQEFTLGLMDSERKLIKEIDEALDRIENSTYGICEGSGKSIPKARLEAIPWARYCIEYVQLLEKGLIREEDSFIESIFNDQTNGEQGENSEKPAGD